MRTLILFALLLSSIALRAEPKPVSSEIKSVKVFLSGAQVSRTAKASLSAGTTVLRFTDISREADPASIQVSGKGAFTILSVKHELNYLKGIAPKEEVQKLEDQIKKLDRELAAEKAKQEVLQREEQFLLQNQKIAGAEKGLDINQLKAINDYFRERTAFIKTEMLNIGYRMEKLNEDLVKLRNQLGQIKGRQPEPVSEVLVEVSATATVQATFELTYIVRSAGWAPAYDIRVESIDKPMELTYRAHVYQSSGEDWDKVALTLSSGDPTQGMAMPEMQPWWLDFGRPPVVYKSPMVQQFNPGVREVRGIVRDASTGEPLYGVVIVVLDEYGNSVNSTITNISGFYALAIPNSGRRISANYIGFKTQSQNIYGSTMNFTLSEEVLGLDEVAVQMTGVRKAKIDGFYADGKAVPDATTTVGSSLEHRATTFEFAIDVPYTIPSNGQQYTVGVGRHNVDALYRHYATPKLDRDAFLFAKATGWEALNLLPGPANLYFEGTFVGESYLDVSTVVDTLDLSLGRDKGVSITRTKRTDFTKRQFIGNKRTVSISWELAVRNNKGQAIDLVITDQYPLSKRSEIEVSLDEHSGADVNKEKGFLTWNKKLAPSASDKWHFTYSVKYPKGQVLYLE